MSPLAFTQNHKVSYEYLNHNFLGATNDIVFVLNQSLFPKAACPVYTYPGDKDNYSPNWVSENIYGHLSVLPSKSANFAKVVVEKGNTDRLGPFSTQGSRLEVVRY